MPIKLIAGLGNPGKAYQHTRHNAGFWLLDQLAIELGLNWQLESRFKAYIAKLDDKNWGQVWLIKPQTFMNLSGQAIAALAHFYKINFEEILLVHDELDLAPGVARLKKGGGVAGHNGLKSTVGQLGSQAFWRLRIGIGHPRDFNLREQVADYVLQRAPNAQQQLMDEAIYKALRVLPLFCSGETEKAMMNLHS